MVSREILLSSLVGDEFDRLSIYLKLLSNYKIFIFLKDAFGVLQLPVEMLDCRHHLLRVIHYLVLILIIDHVRLILELWCLSFDFVVADVGAEADFFLCCVILIALLLRMLGYRTYQYLI